MNHGSDSANFCFIVLGWLNNTQQTSLTNDCRFQKLNVFHTWDCVRGGQSTLSRWPKTACDVTISPERQHPNYSASEAPEEKAKGNNNWFCFLRGSAFWKTPVHFLLSPVPYFGASNLGKIYANFSGEIVTSLSILDHWVTVNFIRFGYCVSWLFLS